MKRAVVTSIAAAAWLAAAADPAAAETIVAGRDDLISYFMSDENVGQRRHKIVRTDGASGDLPVPSGLGNDFNPGAPFDVEISPDGRLMAYKEARGTREGRLVIARTDGGGSQTLATAGSAPPESGRPDLDGIIAGLSFAPDGRRLAVSYFKDSFDDVVTDVLTLDVLVDDPPDPVPPPRRLAGNVAGVHWDGDRILASKSSGSGNFSTVAFDAETYASLGAVSGSSVQSRGPHGELLSSTFDPGTTVTSTTAGTSSATDVIRLDTGETLYNGSSQSLPANCFAGGTCPEFEQVVYAMPAPSGKGYAVEVMRWNRFNKSFMRLELHDENRQFVRVLAPEATTSTFYHLQNWAAQPLPVVFVPGFLGSEITCDGSEEGDELWPALPFPPFERFQLQADGLSGETGAGRCPSAGPTKLLESALGKPIYSGVKDWLEGMEDVDASFLAWDWRKRPQESVAALDAMVDAARERAGTDRVQLIAHSYGGLLARVYADQAARREKLDRVVTLGTPYWGAVKSSFPLFSGEEMIGGGSLDSVLDQAKLQAFARNLGGLYHLWPSQSFGAWLNTGSGLVGAGAIGTQLEVFGGRPALHAQGRSLHASTLDGFGGIGDLDWTVLAGASTPTPVSLTLSPGTGADLEALVAFDDGDGTVPLRSASLGTLPGGGSTPGAKRRVVRACGVEHVPLPNDAGVRDRLLPWLRTGAPIADAAAACPATGWHVQVHDLDLPGRAAGRGVPAGQGLADLELAGKVDVFGFGDDLDIVVRNGAAVTVPLEAAGATLELTPLSGATRGATRSFGTLAAGVRQLRLGAPGAEPTLDGHVAPNAPGTGGPGPGGGTPGPGGGTPAPAPPAGGGQAPVTTSQADRRAPRTTAKLKRLRGKRFRVTLRARDRGGSGVARISYRVGKRAKLKRYRRPFVLPARKLKQLRVGAVDKAGNRERLHKVRR